VDRLTNSDRKWIPEIDVAPGECGCVQNAAFRRIYHAGHHNAYSFARTYLFVVSEYLLDATRELLNQHVDVAIGLKAADWTKLPAHQIRDEDISAGSANINADYAALAGVDVEKSRFSPATQGFTNRAFEDEVLAEELAHQQTGDAAAHVHQPGKVSTRDGLVCANEVQGDLPVDFAAGPTPSYLEIVWIDLPHVPNCSLLRQIY
jgi:hypothetical protein